MGEQLYTLEEADRELRRRECMRLNHDWEVIETWGVGPTEIICSRCGESQKVGVPNG